MLNCEKISVIIYSRRKLKLLLVDSNSLKEVVNQVFSKCLSKLFKMSVCPSESGNLAKVYLYSMRLTVAATYSKFDLTYGTSA
mgnify:CR=1 FL=1